MDGRGNAYRRRGRFEKDGEARRSPEAVASAVWPEVNAGWRRPSSFRRPCHFAVRESLKRKRAKISIPHLH